MAFEPFFQILRGIQARRPNARISGIQNAHQIAFLRNLQKEMKQEDALSLPLQELKVVVFDIETTGFFPEKGDGIISIGATKMKGGDLIEEESFYSLVRYDKAVPPEIEELTGITTAQAEASPELSDIFIRFMEFKEDSTLVAHHAQHERAFMHHASSKLFKTPFTHRIVDTSFLFKAMDPEVQLLTLDDWCRFNDIPIIGRHHALGDAKMTAKLWSIYVNKAMENGCETLRDVYERYSRI